MSTDTKQRLAAFWRKEGARYEDIRKEQQLADVAHRKRSDELTAQTLKFTNDLIAALEDGSSCDFNFSATSIGNSSSTAAPSRFLTVNRTAFPSSAFL